MRVPLQSGLTWEEDPAGNAFDGGGRTERTWIRSVEVPRRYAMFKRPRPGNPHEIYAMGMERVAYGLAEALSLKVPAVHLEEFNGAAGSVHARLPQYRDLVAAGASPMMYANILDRDTWPLAVAFDIMLANVDRVARNLLIAPEPPDTRPGLATAGTTWLIDHGFAGLFPPAKFDPALLGHPCAAVTVTDGQMTADSERRLRDAMVPEYRNTLLSLDGDERAKILDLVRGLDDDAIDEVVMEIPEVFMSRTEVDSTSRLLKLRRDALDQIVKEHWLVP